MPPGDEEPENSHRRAYQPARLEQRERQNLRGERREQVEAAAVIIEIDPRQRALVAETRGVELEQQVAVFGVGVVVPAQAVVAKRQEREDAHDPDRRDSEPVRDTGWTSSLRGTKNAGNGRRDGHVRLGRVLLGRTSGHRIMARFVDGSARSRPGGVGRSAASTPGERQVTASQRPVLLSALEPAAPGRTAARSVCNRSQLLHRRVVHLRDVFPIHQMIHEGLEIVRPSIAIIDVVGMLPHVAAEDRLAAVHQRVLAVRASW